MAAMINRLKKLAADQEKFTRKLKVAEQQSLKALQLKRENIEVSRIVRNR